MKRLKRIPTFENEDQEREFWATHDSTEYVDYSRARHIALPHLKPSTKTISLRLPEYVLNRLRSEANRRDVPYQSFMKQALVDHLEELRTRQRRAVTAR